MQLRRFGLKWTNGGYEDQPYILTEELNAVCRAEEEHMMQIAINKRNREKFDAPNGR